MKMFRSLSARLGGALLHHAAKERYPTRTVEHMLAWMMVVWSAATAFPGNMLIGPTFKFLTTLAPEWGWGTFGLLIGSFRVVALWRNGSWRRSPGLRFLGAMFGMIWWLIVSALYWLAVQDGAPDFPMRYVFFVFIFFEGYSCFRCGQDHASPKARDAAAPQGAAND